MYGRAGSPDELGGLKAQFLSTLNYEVRTPLTGILGMLDLLLETELSEEQRDFAHSSRICAVKLLDIMNATLEYAALSARQVTLEESEFSPRALLGALASGFTGEARAKDLRLNARWDDSLPETAVADAVRLRKLLSNLVENAIKFTRRGTVEIAARCSGNFQGSALLIVRVTDTGIGMPAAALGSIFDSFRQVERGIARPYTGMGLGLAVARELAGLMGAELSVESEVGVGSAFTLAVPVALPPPAERTGNGETSWAAAGR